MLADMSNYMNNDYSTLGTGYGPAQFPHANLQNLFWWCWNANSGDTGVCTSSTICLASDRKEPSDSRLALSCTEIFTASVGCRDVCLMLARFHTPAVTILCVAVQPPVLYGQCMCVMRWRASLHNDTALTPLRCSTQVALWRMTGSR